jgi:hypothetical protein
MDYETAIKSVVRDLRGHVAKEVHMNFGEGYFRQWAEDDGGVAIAKEYQSTFKKYFGERITSEIDDVIYAAGRSVGYLLIGLFETDADIDDVVRTVVSFVINQVTNMDEWCNKLSR